MPPFDLEKSMERARRRLAGSPALPGRKRRSDRGVSRLDPAVLDCIAEATSGQERPRMRETISSIAECCGSKRLAPPSRASIYKLIATLPGRVYRAGDLPEAAQAALYNLGAESRVPGRQLAFYCFNYGDLKAMTFAAGLPWLAIYQALRMPGYRVKSRGLIEAVAAARRI